MLVVKSEYRISSPAGWHYDTLQSFSQREDVQQALPYLSRRRKTHLTTIHIHAGNGEDHEYFVLRQGRKRFLFDYEEYRAPTDGASEKQKENRLSLTLVVPKEVMQSKGYISQDEGLRLFQSRRDTQRFFKTMEQEGYFAMRGFTQDPRSIENNTDFIQPIPAVVVKDTQNNILFTVRDSTGANHDYRLSGMIAAPFTMGHSDPGDFGLWRRFLRHGLKQTMYREAAEETALQKDGKTFHVFPEDHKHRKVSLGGIMRMKQYYDIKPLGVVYKDTLPVDRVHAGVIFTAKQRRKNVDLTLGSSREIAQIKPLSSRQYEDIITDHTLIPASWNEPIVREVFASSPRRKGLRQMQ